MRSGFDLQRLERGRSRSEKSMPASAAPVQIGREFRDLDLVDYPPGEDKSRARPAWSRRYCLSRRISIRRARPGRQAP